MKCRELQFEIHHFANNEVTSELSKAIEGHLDVCPLCRTKLDAIASLRRELSQIRRERISYVELDRIRAAVAAEFPSDHGSPVFRLIENEENWSKKWFWPTTVGTLTSFVFGILLLAVILIPANVPQLSGLTGEPSEPIFLASIGQTSDLTLTPQQFAHSRADISRESPSLNPEGTLAKMPRADEGDDEVVVVADIYSNGSAQIAGVIERPRDRRLLDRLIAAFSPERAVRPFVPASMDNRDDLVRVVMKFQNVNVSIGDAAR